MKLDRAAASGFVQPSVVGRAQAKRAIRPAAKSVERVFAGLPGIEQQGVMFPGKPSCRPAPAAVAPDDLVEEVIPAENLIRA